VVGYVRVPMKEQVESGVGLVAQKHRIREYCTANGWMCVEISDNDGYSGKDLRRPGLQRFLTGIGAKNRPSGAVVVAKLDRLTRSVRDLIRLTELLLRQRIALVSIQEGVDTSTATRKMFYTLVTVISEWERGVIGERTWEALAHKCRNGELARHRYRPQRRLAVPTASPGPRPAVLPGRQRPASSATSWH